LENFFKKLSGLQKCYLKQLDLKDVKAWLVANDAFTEFNLLKTRKASVSEIIKKISILVLTPPPLDYKGKSFFTRIFVYFNLLEMNLKMSLVLASTNVIWVIFILNNKYLNKLNLVITITTLLTKISNKCSATNYLVNFCLSRFIFNE